MLAPVMKLLRLLYRFLLWLMDAVPTHRLAEAEKSLDEASDRIKELEQEAKLLQTDVATTENKLGESIARWDRSRWTNPYLVELPLPLTPARFARNTWNLWQSIANAPQKFGDPAGFKGGINAAGLYWALTHASRSAYSSIKLLKNEDGMTSDFVHALQEELVNAQLHFGTSISVAVAQIFQNRKPALKEVSVGADLLILVSGSGLVQGGGVRLLWIQVKQAAPAAPMQLDVYRAPNKAGGTQLDALRSVHDPVAGSFGLYAMGALPYYFLSSTVVDKLTHVMPKHSSTCQVDLGDIGARFQEVMVDLISNPAHGYFSTSSAVVSFVDALAAEKSIVPLTVLGISSGNELSPVKALVPQIKAKWEQRLNGRLRQITNDPTLSIERDDGPRPRG